jgi:hypothetical protein
MNLKALLSLLPLAGIVSAAEIPTESADDWRLNAAEKRAQTIRTLDYSPEIGKVLEITMKTSAFHYIELNLKKPITIAASAEELKGVVFTLDLFGEPAGLVQQASVRLVDSTGETFQYGSRAGLRPGTWATVTIPVEKPVSVWGGNQDRKIDFPVRFRAVAIDCDRNADETVRLLIDRITWNR